MAPDKTHFDLIVIGAGPVGMHLARRAGGSMSVLVLDADPGSPDASEGRARLLRLLAQGPEALAAQRSPVCPASIVVQAATRVVTIERTRRAVVTTRQQRFGYSHLVLALGASPRIPNLDGSALAQVQAAYRRHEIVRVARAAAANESIVIIGGGLLAVEMAAGIAASAQVTLVARSRLLRGYADMRIAERVARHLRSLGVVVRTDCRITRINGKRRVESVSDSHGNRFRAYRIIFACGVQPNVRLARAAGLNIENGIVTDDAMRTNDPRIFAVGDCARPSGRLVQGSVACGIRQAERVAAQLLGGPDAQSGDEDVLNREIELCGFRFVTAARRSREHARSTDAVSRRLGRRAFSINFCERHIISCQALLPSAQAARLAQLADSRTPVSAGQRLRLSLCWIPRPRAMADTIVCQCAGVRRSSILEAARLYGADAGAIGQATGAGLYCGGCVDELAILAGTRSRSRGSIFGSGTFVLLLAVIAASLPGATPGATARNDWFAVYSLLTGYGVQQASGWLAFGFIVLALGLTAPRRFARRRRSLWLHLLLGALALLFVPLHALGGVGTGSGLNSGLIAVFLVCIVSGVFVWFKRSLRTLAWLHAAATVALLSALVLHVISVYQY